LRSWPSGNRVDQLDLVGLALLGEDLLGPVAAPGLLGEGFVRRDDLAHLRLDGGEVLRGEGLVAGEVVVEAVLDHRADGHLRSRKKLLHGLGQNVRAIVPDQLQRPRVLAAEELDSGVPGDRIGEIGHRAVERHGDGALGQRLGDALRDLAAGGAGGVLALGAIGECQGDHGHLPPGSLLPTEQVSGTDGVLNEKGEISRRQVRLLRRRSGER
jgi:hypothetical protein